MVYQVCACQLWYNKKPWVQLDYNTLCSCILDMQHFMSTPIVRHAVYISFTTWPSIAEVELSMISPEAHVAALQDKEMGMPLITLIRSYFT
jgi:hypothetical protein